MLARSRDVSQVQPEQLITEPRRTVTYKLGGLNYNGTITEVEGDKLVIELEDGAGEYELTVVQVLACLVGPPPDPALHEEAPPTAEEESAACELWYKKGGRTALKKKHTSASADELQQLSRDAWLTFALERRLLWVRKVRLAAGGREAAAPPAPRTILRRGEPVPPALVGRHKGMEVLLVERGLLLPTGGLRGACAAEKDHTANNRCCCRRLLGSQPDFKSEVSALERIIAAPDQQTGRPAHRCLFLPKYHCELNWIERYWGAAKKYARRHCGYSLAALRLCIPIALSQSLDELPLELRASPALPVSPLLKQRRWARISWRYAAEYRKGESGNAVVRAVAQQCSKRHRDTSDPRARQAEAAMEAAALSAIM